MIESKQNPKELWQLYNINDFIDAKDNQSDWRVGYIIEKNLNARLYKIRFDGWGSKYDQTYRFLSPKLMPFRTIVVGYTGQKKNPGLRGDWKFSLKNHQERVSIFNQYCSPQPKSAWEINQFFRGHNYFYTDFLMTETYQTQQDITAVMGYFLANVKLVINYLKNIDPEFKKYYRSHQITQQSHLIDPESAKANAFYELMDTLYIISGSYTRLESFFSKNATLLRKYLNIDFEKNVRRHYQMKIFQEVLKEDGFAVLEQLIEQKFQNTKNLIPFLFLKSLVSLYIGLTNQIVYKEKKKHLDMLVQITKVNLQKLDDKYLKDLNKAHVVQLFDTLKSAYENSDDQQTIRNWALTQQVLLYQKMASCPFFDKKLKGVIGFQQLSQKNKMQPYAGQFIQALLKYKIFDSLFTVDNAEIIRKASQFCKSLYYNQMFPTQIAFRIWQMREGKHEAALQQIYALIAILPSKYNNSQFEKKLFEEISKQPKEQWDQDYIKMIKEYSLTAVGWASSEDKKPQKYGFNILYNYAVMKKSQFAISSFIQLLTRFEKTQVMSQFINECFSKIQNSDDTFIYVCLLLKIIEQNASQFKQINKKATDIVIQDLIKNSNDLYEKNIKRFQLLSQVTNSTNTNLTLQSFLDLWGAFKNKPSQHAYHEWILSKKDEKRLQINSKITNEIRKQIFQKIWCNDYNFQNISQKQAQLFVQFFKAVNINANKIKKLYAIIKTQNLNLIGLDKIWKAFQETKNQKISSTLAQLIVQLHMCPSKSQEEFKEEWTKQLISEFSKKIVQAYKQKNLTKIKKLLLIPSKIIERDQQIFNPKPVKNYLTKQYKITNKESREQKIVKFNLGGLIYDFKKIVAQKFKVPFKKCKLSCKGQQIKYQNYFRTMNECTFSNAPFQLQILQQQPPSIKKYLNNELQVFFHLLEDHELQRQVWDIIEKLPIAEDQLKKLENSKQPWEEINDPSIYRELYIMRVMVMMDSKWWGLFCTGPGFINLTKKFNRVTGKAKIQREYLKVLCESVQTCIDISASLKQINLQEFVLSMQKSLNDLLDNLAEEAQIRKNSVQVSIVNSIFNISKKLSSQVNFMQILHQKNPNKTSLLSKGLITTKSQPLRKQFTQNLKQSSRNIPPQNIQPHLHTIYKSIFNLATSYPHPEQTVQYFEYASDLVGIVEVEEIEKFLKESQSQIIGLLERGLYQQKGERSSEDCNYQLTGYLVLMRKFVGFCTQQQKAQISDFIIYKCFFPHLQNQNLEVICKTKESKTAAFQLLASLLRQNQNSLKALQILSSLHKNALWRTRKLDDWALTPGEKIKSASGYVGIKNLGCICYMNSLFQQIFMIPDFRQAILQCQDPLQQKQPPHQNVLYQVKKMFYFLLNSDTKYYMPNQFCMAFKNYEGQPTNVFQQMDIDEFSNVLFDRLENQIKGTPYENIIKDFFGGVFSNQIICKGCPHFSETEESFLSISLNVKSKKNIYQSFDAMIKGDNLDGDNAYFCQRCNKKVPAVKRVCLKKLPDHLILTLKRFQFDFQTMNKIKLNDYCEFPTQLNVKQYSQQYLRKQQNPDKFEQDQILPDSYYDYTLQGVVIHIGHADSGHYFSYIKERKPEGKWFQFNDTIVRPFDIRKLAEEAFGGEMGTIQVKEKIKNAYMLIYQRKKKLVNHSKLIDYNKNLSEIPIYSKLKQQIKSSNIIQKIQNILFSSQYTKFATNLTKHIQKMQPQTRIAALKYITLVYLTVIIREKEQSPSFEFLRTLYKTHVQYPVVNQWIVGVFTAQRSLIEFFRNNPAKEVKKLLGCWLGRVVQATGVEVQYKFIDALIAYMVINSENCPEFCQILYEMMAKPEISSYVIKKHIAGILLENIYGKQKCVFKNLQELTVVQSMQSQIGRQIIIQKSTYQQNKKIKYLQQTPYVWGILSRLVQKAQSQSQKLSQLIPKQQLDLFQLPLSKIYKVLQQCKCKFMINSFCKILTYLAINNQKFTEDVMGLGFQGLKEFESKRYRQFFIMLNRFAKIQDQQGLVQYRNRKALDSMIRALRQNQKYSLDSNIIQQWLIKSIRKNPNFQSLLVKQPQLLKYLTELTTKKQPTDDVCRKNDIFNENTVNKFHGIKMLRKKKGYEQLAKHIEKFYLDLAVGTVEAGDWNSDEDLTEREVAVGDTVALFDAKDKIQFVQAKIEQNLLSRLTLTANKTKISIWKDDEKLTAGNYPFEQTQSEDDLVDSENTTEMEYEDQLSHVI